MKVSLPSSSVNRVNFKANMGTNSLNAKIVQPQDEVDTPSYSEKEIRIAKTKKVLSECRVVAMAAIVFYFSLKNNFKANKKKRELKKMTETAKLKKPDISQLYKLSKDFSKFFK